MNWEQLTGLFSLNSFPLKLIFADTNFRSCLGGGRNIQSIFAFKWVLQPIYICHKLGQMLSLHYILKMFDKFLWNGLKIREIYSRFRQNGKHFVLTSQTTQLRRETSRDGYWKSASKYFQLPLAVVDIRRHRILRSLISVMVQPSWLNAMSYMYAQSITII